MFHSHTAVFSRTASRRLLVFVTGILIILIAAICCQTALTEDAQADSPEDMVVTVHEEPVMETDEIVPGADEDVPDGGEPEGTLGDGDEPEITLDNEDPAEPEDADETGDRESVNDGESIYDKEAVSDKDIDTENVVDSDVVAVLSESPADPEPPADDALEIDDVMKGIETEKDDESVRAEEAFAVENIKLRSGGVSADPMDVLLGIVAQHQREGNNIRVISSDPTTGRVVYATD